MGTQVLSGLGKIKRFEIALVLATGMVAGGSFGSPVLSATPPFASDQLDGPIGQPLSGVALPDPTRPATAVVGNPPPSGNPLWAVPLRSLSATRERPLFSPSRRPPAPPAVAAAFVPPPKPAPTKPPEPDHPLLALVGTIAGETEGIGIFLDDLTRNIVRLKTGEKHGGWLLLGVRGRQATFEKDHRTAVLTLPAPGAEPTGQVALPVSANQPSQGTWRDGDGQLIAPPRTNGQLMPAPVAAAQAAGDSWMGSQEIGNSGRKPPP
jgi:hypothetical protein